MRQQPLSDESLTDAEAMRMVRDLSSAGRNAPRRAESESQARRAVLTRTVEDEVIPRLLMARRPQSLATAQPQSNGPEQIAALVQLVLNGTQPQAAAFVEAIHQSGVSTEQLLLDLLTPAARRLGVMWEEDTCDFSDVTIGVVRLANVMRLVSSAFDADPEPCSVGPRALLVQMPGEQHGFGLAMVVHFFRRGGWNVRAEPVISSDDLIGLVKQNWFGIVGISVACSDRLEALANDIRAIRRDSRNPAIGIMVGGPPFIEHPQLAAMLGADATATDGRQAVQQARSLVSLLARER